jgi:hypothetical protein
MEFEVHGPFELRGIDDRVTQTELRDAVRHAIDDEYGLGDSCGCYVYALSSSGSSRIVPWYIGSARKSSFRDECITADKADKLNRALKTKNYRRFRIKLYLLPLITSTGRFAKPTKRNGHDVIDWLEKLLIGMAVRVNGDLINLKNTKAHRKVIVPNLLNHGSGPGTHASRSLKQAFTPRTLALE